MNTHNDIEQLCEALVNAQRDLECLELNYVGATEEHMPWLRREHERCVYAELEADGMLDAALDEVFAVTLDQPEPDPNDEFVADEWCRIPGKGYAELQMWIGVSIRARVKELQATPHPF